MKVVVYCVLSLTLLCAITFAQDTALSVATAACGPKEERLKVNTDAMRDQITQPEPGKALVYVVEDYGFENNIIDGGITYKVGVDGTWVGAINRHSPYLALSLPTGEHHLCVNWQSRWEILAKAISLAHVDAQPDKTYYFRIRTWQSRGEAYVDLDPIDSDQGKLLVASAQPKK